MAYNQILADDTGSEHIIEIKDLCKSFDGTLPSMPGPKTLCGVGVGI